MNYLDVQHLFSWLFAYLLLKTVSSGPLPIFKPDYLWVLLLLSYTSFLYILNINPLPTNLHLGKLMVFPVVKYGWESWTIKKAEWRRIYAFELRCWRRLLRVS